MHTFKNIMRLQNLAKDIDYSSISIFFLFFNIFFIECPAGTFGDNCSTMCPDNYFGRFCDEECHCSYS